jgi:hypothetical protein
MRLVLGLGHRLDYGTRMVRLGGIFAIGVVLAAGVSFAMTGDPEQAFYNGVSTVGGMMMDERYEAQVRCDGKTSEMQVFALSKSMARNQLKSDYPDCRISGIEYKRTRTSTSLYR